MATLELGQRIADREGFRGVVRYLGPVATSKSAETIYAGVEWDDGSRGKNDGSVVTTDGAAVRYFTCGSGHGSFVKVELLDVGTDMLTALMERYCDTATALTGGAIHTGAGRAVPIMLVGDAKVREQQRLEKLTSVALAESRIARLMPEAVSSSPSASPVPSLGSLCPRLREVDLRANLVGGWALLAQLGRELPQLQVLNISQNRLAPLLPGALADFAGCFPALRVLIMNDMRPHLGLAKRKAAAAVPPAAAGAAVAGSSSSAAATSVAEEPEFADDASAFWRHCVEPVHCLAPALEELHATANGIRGIVPAPAAPRLLLQPHAHAAAHASSTGSGDADVAAGAFWVAGVEPQTPPAAPTDAASLSSLIPAGLFPRLRTLNLSDNALTDWGHVFAFSNLPSLTTLQLANNELTAVWTAARIPPPSPSPSPSAARSPESAHAPVPFSALEALTLSGNSLADLAAIDALDSLPRLACLRLGNADIAGAVAAVAAASSGAGSSTAAASSASISPSEARQLLIARLPKLTSLNNSEVRPREREDAEKAYVRRVGQAFASSWTPAPASAPSTTGGAATAGAAPPAGSLTITDIFPAQYVAPEAVLHYIAEASAAAAARDGSDAAAAAAAASATASAAAGVAAAGGAGAGAGAGASRSDAPPSSAALPAAFQKTGDSGVIRAARPADVLSPFYTAPLPLCLASLSLPSAAGALIGVSLPPGRLQPLYLPRLDPFHLGSTAPAAAARLQASFPRYFMLAGRYDLHAPSARDVGAASTIAASAVSVTLRSMAGSSCMMEPVTKRLPLAMTVLSVKQLAARLFRNDPGLQRVSFRDAPGSYPSLLDDDSKSLSYYGVADGGELLIEEINPAEAARQAAEEQARREAALAQQAALGDVLHKAQEASVAADRRAVLSTAAPPPVAPAAVAAKPAAAKPALASAAARKPKPADDDDDAI